MPVALTSPPTRKARLLTLGSRVGLAFALHWLVVHGGSSSARAQAHAEPRDASVQITDGGIDMGADGGVASDMTPPPPRTDIRVAVAGSAPFVIPHDDRRNADGFSMDVLHLLADEAGFNPRITFHSRVSHALSAVEAGQAEIAVGPISVTAARASRLLFLQPYYGAPLGILTAMESSFSARFAPFLTGAFALAVITLSLVLMLVGVLMWLAERRSNGSQFPQAMLPGVANGMWFALVTMTTVGYGDRAPVTTAGRIISSVWMIVAMITASSLTAGIATALTLSQIDPGSIRGLLDLPGRSVAVVAGTPAMTIARRHGAELIPTQTKADGLSLLQSAKVDAFLYDLPVLEHYQQEHPGADFQLVRTELQIDDYAFAVALDNHRLANQLNVALIALKERGQLREVEERWLP